MKTLQHQNNNRKQRMLHVNRIKYTAVNLNLKDNGKLLKGERPVNNLVEILSPVSGTIQSLIKTPAKPAPTTTTTTTTTTTAVTSPSIPPTSTTAPPITMNQNAFGTTFDDLAFLNALVRCRISLYTIFIIISGEF